MKNTIFILLISSFLLASCGQEEVQEKKIYETATVQTGSIGATDRVLATVEGKTTTSLSFKVPGRVATMLVKAGDTVQKGQILATLSNEEGGIMSAGLSGVLGDMARMGLSVDVMRLSTTEIRKALDILYNERIANMANDTKKADIGVELARKDLELARTNLANSLAIFSGSLSSSAEQVSQATKNLTYATNALENTRRLLAIEDANIQKNTLSSMSNAFIIARNARDFTDEVIGVTDANRAKNDGYEIYLGAKNSSSKTEAESTFRKFNTEYEAMYTWYYANIVGKTTISKDTLKEGLNRSLLIMTDLRDMLHAVSNVLENSITSSNFPDSALQALKTQTSTLLGNVELSILTSDGAGIKGSINGLDTFASTAELKLTQLEDARILAEENLTMARTGKDTSASDVRKNIDALNIAVRMKEDALRMAQIGTQEVIKGRAILEAEKTSKLREIEAKIAEIDSKNTELDSKMSEVSMNRNLANNTIESGIIRAPFDGIILSKTADVGTVVNAGTPVFSVSSIPASLIRINFSLSETPLEMGQKVAISPLLDTLSGALFAKVVTIRKEADPLHNKQYAELELTDTPLSIGDRVEVLLSRKNTEAKEGIILPNAAIITKYGEPGVYVLAENTVQFTLVTILSGDGTESSVSGVQPGQKVITKGKENIIDGEVLQ